MKPVIYGNLNSLNDLCSFSSINPTMKGKGETFPYSDYQFSRRILKDHLCQEHSLGSRPLAEIKEHVQFLLDNNILKRGMKVLDLGCGPGLYAKIINLIDNISINYTGVDISPGAIEYAKSLSLPPYYTFIEKDIISFTKEENVSTYHLIMLFYEVFNFFCDEDVDLLLKNIKRILDKDGVVFLELRNTFPTNSYKREWFLKKSGLFSDQPYLELLEEGPVGKKVWGHRHIIIDLNDLEVNEYRNFLRIYTYQELLDKLLNHGLKVDRTWANFKGDKFYISSPKLLLTVKSLGG